MASETFTFTPHSQKQDDMIFSDVDLTVGATGTQWGKSQGGSLWMKRQIHQFTDNGDNFLLGAPSYKIMQQSMLPYFLSVMKGYGEYNKTDAVFELSNNRHVYMRTETDPDSVVGIPKLRAGWLDEAGKLRLYFWENYQARAASVGARTLLTTSPYARNWMYKDIVKPSLAGKIPEVKLIRAASWENPYHTYSNPVKRQEGRSKMDPRRFDMIFGGEWGQMAGLVYDCWDEDVNLIPAFQLPNGTKFHAGVDWGYNPDPFVLKVRAITPAGEHYAVSEFYKTGMTLSDIIIYAKQVRQTWDIKTFWCDPSQPGSIEEFCRNGLPAQGSDNDINRGVALHYELIKTRKFKMFKGYNPYTQDELETYHYPEPKDLGPDQDSKEQKPVDQNNHCMDVDRYLTISTYRHTLKSIPKSETEEKPAETNEQRLRRLMRRRSHSSGQENFS